MTPVERYRAALDETKAPDTLKERLLAIPTQYGEVAHAAGAAEPAVPQATAAPTQHKKAIRFAPLPQSWKKQALAAAACFLVGVLATDALGWQVIPSMGSDSAEYAIFDTAVSTGTTSGGATTTTGAMPESAVESGISLSNATVDISESATATDANAETTTRSVEEDTSRKIIYTTSITLETMAYDDTLALLNAALSEAGGYLEYSEHHTGDTYNNNERSSYFTYRIPATAYSSFLNGVSEAGSIAYQTESANDVTSTYLDLAARITTLTQQRDRLWELQAEAETLADLLEIEATLTEVLYQIESYQSQLNYLADQVDYATVTIMLDEVIEYTVQEPSAWDTIVGTFTGALYSFLATIGNLFLLILSLWVWIALALVGVFVYYCIKKKKK